MKTFSALVARINSAKTPEDFSNFQKQIDRHYGNGTLTVNEYKRLDVKIMVDSVKQDQAK
jgi:hypothetical protein